MHFTNAITTIVAFASLALAAPAPEAAPEPAVELQERKLGSVYMCSDWVVSDMKLLKFYDRGFKGKCRNVQVTGNNQATVVPDDFQATLSSVGPDAGQTCYFYYNECTASSQPNQQYFKYPGGDITGPLNDHVKCFKCFW